MKLISTTLLLILLSPLAPALHAEFIQPVAVLASNGQDTAEALIGGQGFEAEPGIGSPEAVHTRTGDMWSGVGSIRESVIFDLGQTVGLTKVYIWNYNVQDATDVGMKDVETFLAELKRLRDRSATIPGGVHQT